jgi:hypothetical protein
MMDDRFWKLKESAKWSLSLDEKRQAVEQLASSYGKDAIETILEIKDVTAYDEVKRACIEAIKSAARETSNESSQGKNKTKVVKKNSKKATKGKRKRNSQ